MKKIEMLLRMLFLSAVLCSMTSCGLLDGLTDDDDDDDDNYYEGDNPSGGNSSGNNLLPDQLLSGVLEDAPFEEFAVKYMAVGDDEIGSIELMASGTYIVMPAESDATRAAHAARPFSLRRHKGEPTRTELPEGGLFGRFELGEEGWLILENFGQIRLAGPGILEIIDNNGESREIGVDIFRPEQGDDLDRRIGRTWHPVSAINIFSGHEYSPEEMYDEFVDYVVISRSSDRSGYIGTFTSVDYGNILNGYGYWGWADKSMQLLNILGYDDDNDPYYGVEQVYFRDEFAIFLEGKDLITCEAYRR